jgi:hypothetical protein
MEDFLASWVLISFSGMSLTELELAYIYFILILARIGGRLYTPQLHLK